MTPNNISDKSNKEITKKFQKTYFDVVGLCCTSEVPLIEKILKPLDGIKKVSVIVPTKTVIVIHDDLLISQIQIVKALNQARLEANVRVYGEEKKEKRWPSLYTMGCGVLLLVALFKHFFHPLKWFAVAAVVVGLPPILFRCLGAIRNVTLDINILVLIAVGGTMAMQDYWEAASIVFLFTVAEWLESRAGHKATAVMSSLMSMVPQKAVLAENGQVVDAKDVQLHTILAVKAGEVIPIDGIVIDGNCEVDEKSLTGEPFPVTKQKHSKVLAGTINLNGYISVKTTAIAEECAVAKMAKLVEEAQNNKSQTQRLIDNCAQYYTPAVVFISISLAAIPAALRVHNLKHWFHLSLVVLVSACPCALILSTPVATFCALTKAATTGLLIKGGDYLEILAKIKIVAFDKTGTITRGEFSVTDFHSVSHDVSLNNLIYWVSSIESKSSHPMAAALVDFGRSNSIEPKPEIVKDYQNFPGEGISGEIDGKKIYVGNRKMAARAGCQIVSNLGKEGDTIGYVFMGETQVGTFSVADTCRTGVAEAINQLKRLKIQTAMLTGDCRTAAMRVQDQLEQAIELVHADLLPQDKARIINELKKKGPTAMIGDGVNDAPALATADIGISMGIAGSALATETGHITLMSNDIGKIPQAIRLARRTRRKIIENVVLSIVTKSAILALAIAGHPLLWAAVLADVGTCLLVIFNSMLLLRGTTVTRFPLSSAKAGCDGHPHKGHCHDKESSCGSKGHAHKGHCHDKEPSCGSKDTHNHRSTSANSKQKCCSRGDTQESNTAQTRSDQTCHSRPVHHHDHHHDHHHSMDSCQKNNSCRTNSKHHDHGGCNTNSSQNMASSHVININKVETTGAKNCEHHSHHEHEHVECSMTDSLKGSVAVVDNHSCGVHNSHHCSESLGKQTNGSAYGHEHSVSITCDANLPDKVSESSMKVVNVIDSNHHSHDHEHCVSKTKPSSTTDCLHNVDGHFNCKNQARNDSSNYNDPTMSSSIGTSSKNESAMVMHWCNSLEMREMDGCCKSFMKECGGHHHGCLGGGRGNLSEIITE